MGFQAGLSNVSGSGNVFLGSYAGRGETGSNKLYIDNSFNRAPLIYGEFDNYRLVIAGYASNNLNNRTFFVKGSAGGTSAWWNDSDKRLKHDIVTIPDALQKVLNLRGVNFLWNQPSQDVEGLQMGFIGQEVAEIVPEVVSASNDHYSMQYAPITALLVEAVKEQQNQIDDQQKEIEELKAIVNSLVNQTILSNK